ncbi:MAG: DUF5684 domain-containing protein [Candidatus Shapirobacteria bacterium]|nr:DUF5684 domain-containing protein [Candidatus Shapirobacteria bacterium]
MNDYTVTTNYQSVESYIDPGVAMGIGFGMGMFGGFLFLICSLILILILVSLWKIFIKAKKPGWAALVPIYNIVVMLEIAGMPTWYIFLMFIPLVNLVIGLMILVNLTKAFGKSTGFVLGMIFLPLIFYPILAFDKSEYIKIKN